ncbi:hypothetical protein ABZX75_29490 [Streptomyces sp. NPDC003038]|uniref:hypothetical protein n=1 Tax=unclassified Streptomyces TaxID=2593676 RepID=UPI0033A6FD11
MGWASWTTTGVFAGAGGVRTEELGIITGDLTIHTTWMAGHADLAVQYTGSSEWLTLYGSPLECASEEESRELHQAVVEAVRRGGGMDTSLAGGAPAAAGELDSAAVGQRPEGPVASER